MKRYKKIWKSARLEPDLCGIVDQIALEQNVSWSTALNYILRQYADLRRILLEERITRMQFLELMMKVEDIQKLLENDK